MQTETAAPVSQVPAFQPVGFWTRFCALFADGVLTGLIVVVAGYFSAVNRHAFALTYVLTFVTTLVLQVYYVGVYGQSPGKMMMGIEIRKLDLSKIGWREAMLRYSVSALFGFISMVGGILAVYSLEPEAFGATAWYQLSSKVSEAQSGFFSASSKVLMVWTVAEIIVFFVNKMRRPIHDQIAKTVVVWSKPKKAEITF